MAPEEGQVGRLPEGSSRARRLAAEEERFEVLFQSIPKECAVDELIEAVRIVMAGQTYLRSTVADKVERAHKAGISRAPAWNCYELTTREREVLQLIVEGHTNKDVAARLRLSAKTVSTHRQHIMDKLNIHNAVGLVKYAIRQGLTSLDDGSPASHDR